MRKITLHILPAPHGAVAIPVRQPSAPLALLRHHVTGAIERGEAEPILEIRDPWHWARKRS